LEDVPVAHEFTEALESSNNIKINETLMNSNTPDPKIMAEIFRKLALGRSVPRPQILYLEKGLVKIEEEAKNKKQSNNLTWLTNTNPSLKLNGNTNASVMEWLGVNQRSPVNAVAPKKSGYFSRALALLAASVAASLAARRMKLGANQNFQQGSGEN
jgi:hypothetical protein